MAKSKGKITDNFFGLLLDSLEARSKKLIYLKNKYLKVTKPLVQSVNPSSYCYQSFHRLENTHLIDYPKLIFTKGDLLEVIITSFSVEDNGICHVTWINNGNKNLAGNLDRFVLLVYCSETKKYKIFRDAIRADEELSIEITLSSDIDGLKIWYWLESDISGKVSASFCLKS